MPFKPEDASKHKKGLSTAQRKKWARIANAILDDCMDTKKDEKDCDAQAIRIANSEVGDNGQD